MTMQPRPNNPIEKRKADVRKYSRNAVLWVGGGVVGGFGLAFILANSWIGLILGLIIGVVGGVVNYRKVRQIVNYED